MNEAAATDRSTYRTILQTLRRRWSVVVLVVVLLPLSALVFSLIQERQYTATASLLFRDPGLDAKLFDSQVLEPSADPEREASTNVRLVSLEVVADRTGRRLGGLAGADVSDKIEVASQGQSDVVAIEATDTNPQFAARLANVFGREYVAFRREADRSSIREAERLLQNKLDSIPRSEREEPGARSLQERAEELQILAALQTGNAELVQQAEVPTEPSSPEPVRNTVLGAALGLLLGIGLAYLLEQLDRRLKDPREVEEIFGRPLLGTVPESRALSGSNEISNRLPASEAEAFRMLRANLRYFDVKRELRSVVVTSAAPGEGKSTVSWNLAAAAAETGSRVLLLESDLRHPSIAKRHGLSGVRGLSTVLSSGDATTTEVVSTILLGREGPDGIERSFDVLVAGPLPPNPADLVESERMAELIVSAEREYDLVVIDTPPTTIVSDAIPLVKQVSGVIMVSRFNYTTRDAARHLQRQLEHLDAPMLGVVVNGVRSEAGGYYGYYGYGAGYGGAYGGAYGKVDGDADATRSIKMVPEDGVNGQPPVAVASSPTAAASGVEVPSQGAEDRPPVSSDRDS